MPKQYMLIIPYSTLRANATTASYWHGLLWVLVIHDIYVSELDPEEPGAIYRSREALRQVSPTPEGYAILMNHLIWPWRPVAAYLQPGQKLRYAERGAQWTPRIIDPVLQAGC